MVTLVTPFGHLGVRITRQGRPMGAIIVCSVPVACACGLSCLCPVPVACGCGLSCLGPVPVASRCGFWCLWPVPVVCGCGLSCLWLVPVACGCCLSRLWPVACLCGLPFFGGLRLVVDLDLEDDARTPKRFQNIANRIQLSRPL